MKTQFGQVESGDFEENTMTLKVDGEMELRAGKYAIVPIEEYEKLNTETVDIRHATPEEIEQATWKEGELYRVKTGDVWLVRVSSEEVGEFYLDGAYDGLTFSYDTYEKLNTCSCGFCVKEKEG